MECIHVRYPFVLLLLNFGQLCEVEASHRSTDHPLYRHYSHDCLPKYEFLKIAGIVSHPKLSINEKTAARSFSQWRIIPQRQQSWHVCVTGSSMEV